MSRKTVIRVISTFLATIIIATSYGVTILADSVSEGKNAVANKNSITIEDATLDEGSNVNEDIAWATKNTVDSIDDIENKSVASVDAKAATDDEDLDYILGRPMTEEEIQAQYDLTPDYLAPIPKTTDFSYMSEDEFIASLYDAEANAQSGDDNILGAYDYDNLPSKYDLRDDGFVTSVKNQNPYGCCWAFATLASLESNILKRYGDKVDLSESHLVHYSNYTNPNDDEFNNTEYDEAGDGEESGATTDLFLMVGGNGIKSGHALSKWKGAAPESKYKYSSARSQKFTKKPYADNIYELDEMFVTSGAQEKRIKAMILKYGAALISYAHIDAYYNPSTAAHYSPKVCEANHAVAIVGWDDSYKKENFNKNHRPQNDGAWIVKNSWGTGWGKNGYFYLSYDDCTMNDEDVYFYTARKNEGKYNNYYYDGGNMGVSGWTQVLGLAQVYEIKGNSEGKELLEGVQLFTYEDSVNYELEVYKYPGVTRKEDVGTAPYGSDQLGNGGVALLKNPQKGTINFAGCNNIRLTEPVYLNEGDVVSFIVRFDKSVMVGVDDTVDLDVSDSLGNLYVVYNEDDSYPFESFELNNSRFVDWSKSSSRSTPWMSVITKDVDNSENALAKKASSISLVDDRLAMHVEDVAQLEYKMEPADATYADIAWESSNPEVLSVDEFGRISALKPGIATITAKCGGVTSKCVITVGSKISDILIVCEGAELVEKTVTDPQNKEEYDFWGYVFKLGQTVRFRAYNASDYYYDSKNAVPLEGITWNNAFPKELIIDKDGYAYFTDEVLKLIKKYGFKNGEIATYLDYPVCAKMPNGSVSYMVYYPLYEFVSNTVSFELNGADSPKINSQKVNSFEADKKFVMPVPPTKKGYTFLGWDTLNNTPDVLEKPFYPESDIPKDMTLYAKWEKDRNYDINLDKSDALMTVGDTLNMTADVTAYDDSGVGNLFVSFAAKEITDGIDNSISMNTIKAFSADQGNSKHGEMVTGVTCEKEGMFELTATVCEWNKTHTSYEETDKKASCTVTVIDDAEPEVTPEPVNPAVPSDAKLIPVDSLIGLHKSDNNISSGKRIQVKTSRGKLVREDMLTFTSANDSIVRVEADGTVYVNPSANIGQDTTVVVTAALKNDEANRRVSVKVTVYKDPQINGIVIKPVDSSQPTTDLIMKYENGATVSYTAEAYDKSGNKMENPKLNWSVSDTKLASVKVDKETGVATVTIKKPGRFKLICKGMDGIKNSGYAMISAATAMPRVNRTSTNLKVTSEGGDYVLSDEFEIWDNNGAVCDTPVIENVILKKASLDKSKFELVNTDHGYAIKVDKKYAVRNMKSGKGVLTISINTGAIVYEGRTIVPVGKATVPVNLTIKNSAKSPKLKVSGKTTVSKQGASSFEIKLVNGKIPFEIDSSGVKLSSDSEKAGFYIRDKKLMFDMSKESAGSGRESKYMTPGKHPVSVVLQNDSWPSDVSIPITLNVRDANSKLSSSPKTIIMSRAIESVACNNAVNITSDCINTRLVKVSENAIRLYDAKNKMEEETDLFTLQWRDGRPYLGLNKVLSGEAKANAGTYTVKIKGIADAGCTDLTTKIKVVDIKPTVSIKQKGTIDLINRSGSQVDITVKGSNVPVEIRSVSLSNSSYYALVTGADTFAVKLKNSAQAKTGTEISTKTANTVNAKIYLRGVEKPFDAILTIKPKQNSVKAEKRETIISKASDYGCKVSADLQSLMPQGVVISRVECISDIAGISVAESAMGTRANAEISLSDRELKSGRYNLKFECYLKGAEATNSSAYGKPTVVVVPVNVVE